MAEAVPNIMCCLCGVVIPANSANMCVNCIRNQVDITEGIPKEIVLQWCKGCGRFQTGTTWTNAEPESRELLSMLVKRTRGLHKVKLVDANFIFTEAHSMRIKVKYTVQREALSGTTILEQSFIVEYPMERLYCPDCHKAQSPHTWVAVVQLRQRGVGHKRTLYYIEQQILKRGAHSQVTSLKEVPDGLDFFFQHQSHARKFVEFLRSITPLTSSQTKKLISQDDHSNLFSYKYTWVVEIPPLCRDDLAVVPRGLYKKAGEGGVFICTKVTSSIHLLDPVTLREIEMTAQAYWGIKPAPVRSVLTNRRLIEYVVIDVEKLRGKPSQQMKYSTGAKRYEQADVTVCKAEDMGTDQGTHIVCTHLGRLLKAGDTVLGYDIAGATNDIEEVADTFSRKQGTVSKRSLAAAPEILLVKKGYQKRHSHRIFTLQRLERDNGPENLAGQVQDLHTEQALANEQRDMEALMDELEQDPEMRAAVPLVKVPDAERIVAEREAKKKAKMEMPNPEEEEDDEDEDDAAFPDVTLDELVAPLQNLSLADRLAAIEAEPVPADEDTEAMEEVTDAAAAAATPQSK